jgi:hypothetical protein
MSSAFFSDDAIYTYAGFAIAKGVTPYAGIALPQPPFGYMLLASEVSLAQSNLPLIRTINFTIFLLGLVFVFLAIGRFSGIPPIAFLGSLIYAVFPPILQYSFSASVEFTYFVALIFAGLYLAFSNSPLSLFGAGVSFGLAGATWYPGIFCLVALLGLVAGNRYLDTNSIQDSLKGLVVTILGALLVITVVLGSVIIVWRAYPQFLTQSLGLQTSLRAGFSETEKINILSSYWETFSPVLVLGVAGMIIVFFKESKSQTKSKLRKDLFVCLWFVSVFTLLVVVPKVLFPHYFWFLTPILGYFSAITLFESVSTLRRKAERLPTALLLITLAAASVFAYSGRNAYPTGAFTNNAYNGSEEYVGQYVANITLPGQLIWTSEPSIAFYANRLIAPPNSSSWKVQGFFDDVFNTSFTDIAMFQHEGSGLVAPVQFEQSWGSNVEVLVFIRGGGPVPYPDTLLWEGWPGTPGVSGWVSAHYSKVAILTFAGNSYWYEIWKRS